MTYHVIVCSRVLLTSRAGRSFEIPCQHKLTASCTYYGQLSRAITPADERTNQMDWNIYTVGKKLRTFSDRWGDNSNSCVFCFWPIFLKALAGEKGV
jgi:hypothetical protein